MMKRRAFLKLFIGTVAIAAIPIPNFLLPKEKLVSDFWKGETVEPFSGSLTPELIEEASRRAIENHGKPDVMYVSKVNYKIYAKHFGYKVEYVGDEIVHTRS